MPKRPWDTEEWKERRTALSLKGKKCEWCGSEDHLEQYVSLQGAVILCRRCHFVVLQGGSKEDAIKLSQSKAKQVWKQLRYRANENCYEPGGAKSRERVMKGECSWAATTCRGQVRVCEDCNIPYCEYHFPLHRRKGQRKSTTKQI